MNIVQAAVKLADNRHDAYYLILHLRSGAKIRGGITGLDHSGPYIIMECPTDCGVRTRYVSLPAIESIEIEP